MEWIENIFNLGQQNIDVPYLLTVVFFAYLLKKFFSAKLQAVTKFNWENVYTVLIIAALIAVPYVVWFDVPLKKIILSYAVATSLHELLFGVLEDYLKKRKKL